VYIIGIDPGKTGGVCVLRKDLSLVALEPLRAPIDNALFFRHLLENQQAHNSQAGIGCSQRNDKKPLE